MQLIEGTNLEVDIYPTVTINGIRHVSDVFFYPRYECFWEQLEWMKLLDFTGEFEFDIDTKVYLHRPIKSVNLVFEKSYNPEQMLRKMGVSEKRIEVLRNE